MSHILCQGVCTSLTITPRSGCICCWAILPLGGLYTQANIVLVSSATGDLLGSNTVVVDDILTDKTFGCKIAHSQGVSTLQRFIFNIICMINRCINHFSRLSKNCVPQYLKVKMNLQRKIIDLIVYYVFFQRFSRCFKWPIAKIVWYCPLESIISFPLNIQLSGITFINGWCLEESIG